MTDISFKCHDHGRPHRLASFKFGVLLLIVAVLQTNARADTIAASLDNLGFSDGVPFNVTYGWSFTPMTSIYVTELGVLDAHTDVMTSTLDIGAGLQESHPVAIWNSANTTTPVVSTTVPSGTAASLAGDCRYEPVTPTLLLAGTQYVIGAYYSSTNSDENFINQLNGVAISNDSAISPYATQVAGGQYAYPSSIQAYAPDLGPNFQFATSVPEPTTVALLSVAAVVLLGGFWRTVSRRANWSKN